MALVGGAETFDGPGDATGIGFVAEWVRRVEERGDRCLAGNARDAEFKRAVQSANEELALAVLDFGPFTVGLDNDN